MKIKLGKFEFQPKILVLFLSSVLLNRIAFNRGALSASVGNSIFHISPQFFSSPVWLYPVPPTVPLKFSFSELIICVAFLWTLFSLEMSFLICGSQKWVWYSGYVLIYAEPRGIMSSLEFYISVLNLWPNKTYRPSSHDLLPSIAPPILNSCFLVWLLKYRTLSVEINHTCFLPTLPVCQS